MISGKSVPTESPGNWRRSGERCLTHERSRSGFRGRKGRREAARERKGLRLHSHQVSRASRRNRAPTQARSLVLEKRLWCRPLLAGQVRGNNSRKDCYSAVSQQDVRKGLMINKLLGLCSFWRTLKWKWTNWLPQAEARCRHIFAVRGMTVPTSRRHRRITDELPTCAGPKGRRHRPGASSRGLHHQSPIDRGVAQGEAAASSWTQTTTVVACQTWR